MTDTPASLAEFHRERLGRVRNAIVLTFDGWEDTGDGWTPDLPDAMVYEAGEVTVIIVPHIALDATMIAVEVFGFVGDEQVLAVGPFVVNTNEPRKEA